MSVTVSGKLVVSYTDEDDVQIDIEISAESIEIGDAELHDGDRGMGEELVYIASASDEHLGDIEWQIYEYPAGVLNNVIEPDLGHPVIESPVFEISADGADVDFEDEQQD